MAPVGTRVTKTKGQGAAGGRPKLKGAGGKALAESPPPSFRNAAGSTPRKGQVSHRGKGHTSSGTGSASAAPSVPPAIAEAEAAPSPASSERRRDSGDDLGIAGCE